MSACGRRTPLDYYRSRCWDAEDENYRLERLLDSYDLNWRRHNVAVQRVPSSASPEYQELVTWHVDNPVTIQSLQANQKAMFFPRPIAGAVCSTVEDVCVKVDQDKDTILGSISSHTDIITTEATAHYDSIVTNIGNSESAVIDEVDLKKDQIIAALVGYLDAFTGSIGHPVIQVWQRLGQNSVDLYSAFEILNQLRDSQSSQTTAIAAVKTVVDQINAKLGDYLPTSDTVKNQLNDVEYEIGLANTALGTVGGVTNATKTNTDNLVVSNAGISAALVFDFVKFVGGTLAIPFAEWVLGGSQGPPASTLTPLTAVDIISNDEVNIDPGMYGVLISMDAPAYWAHRAGPPNYYTPALGFISWFGLDGWLGSPTPIHTEFTEFYPLPVSATSFRVDLAVGVSGTYTVLILE